VTFSHKGTFLPPLIAGGIIGRYIDSRESVDTRAIVWLLRVPFEMEVAFMRRLVVPSLALLAVSFGALAARADLESGPKVGDKAGAFQVKDCTGPAKGKSLCYR
jgi:hypothetical protein